MSQSINPEPGEKHLRNIRQLTFGGENAEAYFAADGKKLIFQATREGHGCDLIYTMNIDGSDVQLISNERGRTTCAYFFPNGKRVLYSSTHLYSKDCPPRPDFSQGYVWALYPSYDIFTSKPDGSDVKQLTNTDGYDAETTISRQGKLVFTSVRDGDLDIYTMGSNGKRVLYSSTHLYSKDCPPRPDFSQGYVWAIYPSYDIFTAKPDGSDVKQLTNTDGYDAETTISRQGKLVFTSTRDGDLDIYTMDANGKNVRRLTNELGYDGGPFWSRNGKQIVYRAYHPQTEKEKADYRALLKQNLIRPTVLDIWVMNADGSNKRRVTNLSKASFAPYFHPDGKRIIFSSNAHDERGRDFDLYMIKVDGTGLERVTFNNTFDGFPMFSPDGKKLVFASNRNAAKQGDTNIFIADWVE
ncbi:MAG: TolB family protein [Pyrinomonadaceae bacterium]